MARIETCQGLVADLRDYAETTAGEGQASSHRALFRLNGRPVRIEIGMPAMLDEGDRLAVAGIVRQGTLQALAYRNLTTGAAGSGPTRPIAAGLLLLIGVVAIVSGLVLLDGGNRLGAVIAFVGVLFELGGLRALRDSRRMTAAIRTLSAL